jgi:hypothetical protein
VTKLRVRCRCISWQQCSQSETTVWQQCYNRVTTVWQCVYLCVCKPPWRTPTGTEHGSAVTLLWHWCSTVVTLLLHWCSTVVALLLRCWYTVVALVLKGRACVELTLTQSDVNLRSRVWPTTSLRPTLLTTCLLLSALVCSCLSHPSENRLASSHRGILQGSLPPPGSTSPCTCYDKMSYHHNKYHTIDIK